MVTDRRISGAQPFPFSESDIRLNFKNPCKIIAAANANVTAGGIGQGQFFSSDGGATWSQTNLPLISGDLFHSDPAVDWTSDGTAWAITIGLDASVTNLQLRSYKSTDGGASWIFDGTVSGKQTNADKELMWADHSPTSPFKDNIYVIWHNNEPVFVNRRTGPSGAWQTPIQVSGSETTGTGIGGDIKTNSVGDAFAFWPDTGSRKLLVAKSTDGGVTFGTPVTIAATFAAFQFLVPADAFRGILVYISGGAYRDATRNLVYALWSDLSGGADCTSGTGPGTDITSSCKSRIWFCRSANGGVTWEPARMINNQPSLNDQFNPKLAVDEASGLLVVIYYDTVSDPGRHKSDVWTQCSFDDGVTWSTARKVTSAQTDETADGADIPGAGFFGDQYGDYNGLSGHCGVFYPSWTDRRSRSREEIWTALIGPASAFRLVEFVASTV